MAGEWKFVGLVLRNNWGIILGMIVPAIVFLRFPIIATRGAQIALAAGTFVLQGLLRTGNVVTAVQWMWNRIIRMSHLQKVHHTLI